MTVYASGKLQEYWEINQQNESMSLVMELCSKYVVVDRSTLKITKLNITHKYIYVYIFLYTYASIYAKIKWMENIYES